MVNRVKTCAVIVAHPDDETLWSGGTILGHPEWQWFVVSLCRKSDKEREAKFYQAMIRLGADGTMGDLDDGPAQSPQNIQEVAQIVLDLLPVPSFDLIITHSPQGEYTRHLRHEETSLAVINLLESRKIRTKELWLFAYEDHQRKHYPIPIQNGTYYETLSPKIWAEKYKIITDTYGFGPESWEAKTTPKSEAFWRLNSLLEATNWIEQKPL